MALGVPSLCTTIEESKDYWEELVGNEEKENVIKLLRSDLGRLSKELNKIIG